MDTTIKKPDKKSLSYLAIVLVVALLVFAGLWYYLSREPGTEEIEEQPTERTLKEIIKDLTAPNGVAEPISEEVMESITAPKSKKESLSVPDDVLKNLTAPK